jgi:hypothetical protein
MLTIEQLLNGLPPDLVLRFFATFARLEFALKHTNCLQYEDNGDVALASRRGLEARLPADFFARVRDADGATTLITRPAKDLYVQSEGPPQFGEQEVSTVSTVSTYEKQRLTRKTSGS